VFSNFRYQGNDNTNQIVNGIDLAGKGGLVWQKARSTYAANHLLTDTVRGRTKYLSSNLNSAEGTANDTHIASFNSDGFTLGAGWTAYENFSGITDGLMSWTFRKAPGFFDIVTYTGNGANRTIAHNLGSVPGMIIVKMRTLAGYSWQVYHRSLANTERIELDNTGAKSTGATTYWNSTTATDSVFSLGTNIQVNQNGQEYVAYLFAHDAQEFGTDEDESIIKCGSFTTDGSGNAAVDVGFEPQWLLIKKTNSTGSWGILDSMRGFTYDGTNKFLFPDNSNTETDNSFWDIRNNGFNLNNGGGSSTFIYVAIRRPHKPAEEFAATDLFTVVNGDGTGAPSFKGVLTDFKINTTPASAQDKYIGSRLQGERTLRTNSSDAEGGASSATYDFMNGWSGSTGLGSTWTSWMWRRAPGFFDVVTYTGTTATLTVNHNLGVKPEMILAKRRDGTRNWGVIFPSLSNTNGYAGDFAQAYLELNNSFYDRDYNSEFWLTQDVTDTTITYGGNSGGGNAGVNYNGYTYVNYLFASLDGISKVGTYTGTGNDLNVDCGFSAGARFILIKRTNSTGDWYVWDSLRGIVAGNDPYLLLNSYAAQVTNTDYIDPLASGFTVTSSAPAALNASGGIYLFYAIA